MSKLLTSNEMIPIIEQLTHEGKRIILAGGCFDILHIGHLTFLQKAKEQGDILFVFVEPDEAITKSKGEGRPINTQEDRAKILAALEIVDYVLLLPPKMNNENYDSLITAIKPAVIATTKGDPNRMHKERQAALVHGEVLDVTMPIQDQSTTRLIALLKESYE